MNFWSDTRGNMIILAGVVLPTLLASAGMAIDYSKWIGQRKNLQGIADSAAIAAARELYLANASSSQITAVAEAVAKAHQDAGEAGIAVTAKLGDDGGSVKVTASQKGKAYFTPMIMKTPPQISVIAVARAMGGGRICVIGLDGKSPDTISTSKSGQMFAPECGVYSNSISPQGFAANENGYFEAELLCSAGGFDGAESQLRESALPDCPAIEDPLADRKPPSYGGCDYKDFSLNGNKGGASTTLYPGVYCGGLEIMAATVIFEPGIYVIKDGPLAFAANAQVTGEHVSFYLVGDTSVFSAESNSFVYLTAPKDGDMAGILFFEDRDAPLLRDHVVKSDDARVLLGTFYLPRGRLVIRTSRPIADKSAYTAIVAYQVAVDLNSKLVINADYNATDIPVPEGIGPVGSNIVLTQ